LGGFAAAAEDLCELFQQLWVFEDGRHVLQVYLFVVQDLVDQHVVGLGLGTEEALHYFFGQVFGDAQEVAGL
jgi:hypothetical protein